MMMSETDVDQNLWRKRDTINEKEAWHERQFSLTVTFALSEPILPQRREEGIIIRSRDDKRCFFRSINAKDKDCNDDQDANRRQ